MYSSVEDSRVNQAPGAGKFIFQSKENGLLRNQEKKERKKKNQTSSDSCKCLSEKFESVHDTSRNG